MLNLPIGDLLAYITATIYLMAILGLGTTLLAKLGKGKLSVLAFALFVGVSTTNLLAFHSLHSGLKVQSDLEIKYVGILAAFLLLVVGSTLMHSEKLKRVGLVIGAIGTVIGVGLAIWLLIFIVSLP